MNTEPFARGVSVVHRVDPRHRLVAAIVFSVVVALCQGFSAIVTALCFALFVAIAAHLNPVALLRRMRVVFIFLLLLWVVLPLTFGEQQIIRLGPLPLSQSGLVLSGRITLKVMSILIGFTALVATMPITTLGHALESLKVSPKIVQLVLMTYRYIDLIEDEYRRSMRALKIRGFSPKTNLHTYKTFAYLIGMLLVWSVNRAERIEWAMRCRGFKGRFYHLAAFPAVKSSWVFSAVVVISTLMIAYFEWGLF